MKCQLCSKEGFISFARIENDQLQQFCYCQDCAGDEGILPADLPSLAELLKQAALLPDKIVKDSCLDDTIFDCPLCQFTREHWESTHRMGCPFCYEFFEFDVDSRIKKLQDNCIKHIGKTPLIQQTRHLRLTQKKELQKLLDLMLSKENYEQAAQIRDLLNAL